VCAKGAANGPQTTLQGKEGHLIIVMNDWEQLQTNAMLLKLVKALLVFLELDLQSHEKAVWKNGPCYLRLFCYGI